MNHFQFNQARRDLGLSVNQLAEILSVTPEVIRRWETDPSKARSRAPNPIACRVLEWMQAGFNPLAKPYK